MRTAFSLGAGLALLAGLAIGCSDDDKSTEPPDDDSTPIIGSVTGIVYNRFGTLDDATVTVGTQTTLTNDDGYFALPGLDVGDVVVRVVEDGYAPAYRNISIRENETTHLDRIVLLDSGTTNLDAAAGGSAVSPDASATVVISGGSLVNAAGDPYAGQVAVEVSAARPGDDVFFDAFSGRFEGRRTDGSTVPFESYGFVSVDLMNANTQQPLRLGDGQTAEIRMTVTDGGAPASIPLWHYDDANGVWIEEGTATRVGDEYQGDVSHFTLWNWDYPLVDLCTIEGVVRSTSGSPVGQARVYSQGVGRTYLDEAYADGMGQFSVRALKNTMTSLRAIRGGTASEAIVVDVGDVCPLVLENPLTLDQAAFSITCSWGLEPDDLDSHLFIPMNWQILDQDYDYYHIAYYSEGDSEQNPFTALNTDDTDSYGPEVISGFATYPGRYEYWVHRYANEGSIVDSPTIVSVQAGAQYRTYNANTASGAETEYWHVFDFVSANGMLTIETVNRFETPGTDDEWENWHGGNDTFYPDTDPEFRIAREK